MNINIVVAISYVVSIVATATLAVYFFREYAQKKLRASLAWGLGLLVYVFAMITDFSVDISGEMAVGKPALLIGLMVTFAGMTLFYYGTSLLFFNRGSFFREKISALLFIFYIAVSVYLVVTLPTEGFKEAVRFPLETFLISPVYFAISILFYRVSARVDSDDPRRQTILFVAAGWFLLLIGGLYRGLFFGSSAAFDSLSHIVRATAWLLILYGMTFGKAARTT
ncbi:MAG: hypothetical protein PVF58_09515 [Candidatus Methanofastidiosia archaeon]|jgi:hypothetical protein